MNIRKATIKDLKMIAEVEAECFPAAEAATEAEFARRLTSYPEHFWLLFDEEKLVGFVNGMVTDQEDLTDEMYENADLHNEEGAWQMIFGVNTIPQYRRRGCAEKLLKRAIADARSQGKKGLVLTCKDKLIHYYAKFGFVNEGISESVHGNATWYQMRLTFRKIEKISLIGLGAMGVFFAPRLYQRYGDNFRIIADGERKKRLETRGVTVNGVNYRFPIVTPQETGDPADLILIGVKGYALSQAIEDIRNQVGENTLILSLLNGVDSEDALIKEFGEEHVLYAYMRMSVVMKDGCADFDPYWGKIHFGEKMNEEYSERVLRVKEVLDEADIPYQIETDMLKGIWFKYMCNIGENMTCALLGIPFGVYRLSEDANWLRRSAMREVAAIAQKKGIDIGEREISLQEETVKTIPFANKPSTLQDLESWKITKIEMFAGQVVKMGKELHIPTPINEVFYHGIRVLEEKNEGICHEKKS